MKIFNTQHERGPRKPKLQNLHSQMVHHHHHHHQQNPHHLHSGFNPMSVNSSSYAHHNIQNHHAGVAAHFTQIQSSFQQHSAILHHPQPLNFGNLLHPTPILPSPSSLSAHHANLAHKFANEHHKLHPSFDFPSINSNFYKPLSQQFQQQMSPTNSKSTISIDSSSASSVSERMMSPHSTTDSQCGGNNAPSTTPIIDPANDIITTNNVMKNSTSEENGKVPVSIFSTSSTGSSVSSPFASAAVTNGNHATSTSSLLSQQTTMSGTRANMQNGLLDILMSPDKYQELIQYHQAQNSIIFPSLHQAAYQIDALNPRLPTWEFLQVGKSARESQSGIYDDVACMHSHKIHHISILLHFCLNDWKHKNFMFHHFRMSCVRKERRVRLS